MIQPDTARLLLPSGLAAAVVFARRELCRKIIISE